MNPSRVAHLYTRYLHDVFFTAFCMSLYVNFMSKVVLVFAGRRSLCSDPVNIRKVKCKQYGKIRSRSKQPRYNFHGKNTQIFRGKNHRNIENWLWYVRIWLSNTPPETTNSQRIDNQVSTVMTKAASPQCG